MPLGTHAQKRSDKKTGRVEIRICVLNDVKRETVTVPISLYGGRAYQAMTRPTVMPISQAFGPEPLLLLTVLAPARYQGVFDSSQTATSLFGQWEH